MCLHNSTVIKKEKKDTLKGFMKTFHKNKMLLLLTLPMVMFIFIFNYIPLFGVIVAFKRFEFNKGIWGSEWIGFDNFKFFFNSPDAWRITKNTIAYNSSFIVINLIVAVLVALMLYEITNKNLSRIYQTTIFIPYFLSWVVVAYMAYAFLNPRSGMLNVLMSHLGMKTIDWYITPKAWIFILPIANLWKSIGMTSILYFASLMGIDPEYYEAAAIEGANKWQVISKITLPFLYPLMTILFILDVGKIFNADFGLFYQLPMDSPMLYATTDVIETYVYRALATGNIAMSSAAGLLKSFVGFVLVVVTNAIVRKINHENSLF